MTIKDCIDNAVAGGEMDPTRAAEAQSIFDEIEQDLLDSLGPDGAAIRASQDTVKQVRIEAAQRRRQKLLAIRRQKRILKDLEISRRRTGRTTGDLATAYIDSTGMTGLSFRGAQQERNAILARAHGMMSDILSEFGRRTLIGNVRNRGQLVNVIREAFGEGTGDRAAGELAKAWYDSTEFLRKQYNAAGGHIAKLERWGLPQTHDTVKIRQSTFQEWRDFILPKLDQARMRDGRTGLPFTGERFELALREVFETLRTDGWSKVRPSSAGGGRALANRRVDHRFLHFKTADDWLAYQDRFGADDVFSGMMAHVEGMARDIGAMRALGPNPQATIRWLQQSILKEANEAAGDDLLNRAGRSSDFLEVLYDHYTGAVNAPSDRKVSRFFSGLRSFLTSAQLGSAALTAITDLNFGRMAARMAGIPETKLVTRHLSLLSPTKLEDQKLAVRLGLIADHWSQLASAQMRYVGEIAGPEFMRRLSDGVLRASGLSIWTQAGRWAFGMEFMGSLADQAKLKFKDLPAPRQQTLRNYNIDADAWDVIRQTEIFEPDKGGFIRPDDVAARADVAPELADDLATRMLNMIQSETEFAIPSASLRGRATFGGRTRPGTISGELIRSTLMYKNFAITLAFTHIRRLADQQGAWNKTKYAGNLVIGTTLMGALSLQLKEIAKGRDPRPMFGDNTAKFWPAALLQGGGLGIFGDFLFQDVNRFGSGFEQTVAGPVVSFATDAAQLTIGNVREILQGDDTNFGRELPDFLKRYTPGASLWYARLALERIVFDQIQEAIDPKAAKRFRRQSQKLERDFGSGFFAPRGQVLPDRLPDFGNVFN